MSFIYKNVLRLHFLEAFFISVGSLLSLVFVHVAVAMKAQNQWTPFNLSVIIKKVEYNNTLGTCILWWYILHQHTYILTLSHSCMICKCIINWTDLTTRLLWSLQGLFHVYIKLNRMYRRAAKQKSGQMYVVYLIIQECKLDKILLYQYVENSQQAREVVNPR